MHRAGAPSQHQQACSRPPGVLQASSLLAVGLVGPPGAGKTSLVEATARQLRGKAQLGVITVSPGADRDADRVSRYCDHVQAISATHATLDTITGVLPRFDLQSLDILLMDVIAGLDGIPFIGQDLTVAVLSVGAGDDKAPLYADLLRKADLLILNKADLQRHVMFDRGAFWAEVHRINPDLDMLEVSSFESRGVDRWLAWLDGRLIAKRSQSVRGKNAGSCAGNLRPKKLGTRKLKTPRSDDAGAQPVKPGV